MTFDAVVALSNSRIFLSRLLRLTSEIALKMGRRRWFVMLIGAITAGGCWKTQRGYMLCRIKGWHPSRWWQLPWQMSFLPTKHHIVQSLIWTRLEQLLKLQHHWFCHSQKRQQCHLPSSERRKNQTEEMHNESLYISYAGLDPRTTDKLKITGQSIPHQKSILNLILADNPSSGPSNPKI